MPALASRLTNFWSTLGWAAYLACSWTWCIGMFLPVLLVRDFGIWGFVVFAVPNIIGAAAMGWVMCNPARSRAMIDRHGRAFKVFSIVTILFQAFFLNGIIRVAVGDSWATNGAYVLFVAAACVALAFPRSASALGWVASVALLIGAWMMRDHVWHAPTPELGGSHVFPLALVCGFGFMLCPYMDLTFHRVALTGPPRVTRGAFLVGFIVLFAAMILGTLSYLPLALDALGNELGARSAYVWLVATHITLQLAITIALHIREAFELRTLRTSRSSHLRPGVYWWFAAVLAVALCAASLGSIGGLARWELVYRLFMSFYGLIFPAYVWLVMLPFPKPHAAQISAEVASPSPPPPDAEPLSRRALTVFLLAITLAAPFYWLGFIERKTPWLIPGIAIVLAARLLVPWRTARGATGRL